MLLKDENNGFRIKTGTYLILAPILYAVWLIMDYYFLVNFNSELTLSGRLNVDYGWSGYLSFFITGLYIIGLMSANELSTKNHFQLLVHAPVVFIALIAYSAPHLIWINTFILK